MCDVLPGNQQFAFQLTNELSDLISMFAVQLRPLNSQKDLGPMLRLGAEMERLCEKLLDAACSASAATCDLRTHDLL